MELEIIAIWNKVYAESHHNFFYIKELIYVTHINIYSIKVEMVGVLCEENDRAKRVIEEEKDQVKYMRSFLWN